MPEDLMMDRWGCRWVVTMPPGTPICKRGHGWCSACTAHLEQRRSDALKWAQRAWDGRIECSRARERVLKEYQDAHRPDAHWSQHRGGKSYECVWRATLRKALEARDELWSERKQHPNVKPWRPVYSVSPRDPQPSPFAWAYQPSTWAYTSSRRVHAMGHGPGPAAYERSCKERGGGPCTRVRY
jgi:hypothetical protein